jgi:hypothetical protein
VSGLELVQAQSSLDSNAVKSVNATCPGDKKVAGGGALVGGSLGVLTAAGPRLLTSAPNADLTKWAATAAESRRGPGATSRS